jgi:uncharacterized iron-regulated membrane protein
MNEELIYWLGLLIGWMLLVIAIYGIGRLFGAGDTPEWRDEMEQVMRNERGRSDQARQHRERP